MVYLILSVDFPKHQFSIIATQKNGQKPERQISNDLGERPSMRIEMPLNAIPGVTFRMQSFTCEGKKPFYARSYSRSIDIPVAFTEWQSVCFQILNDAFES